MSLGERHSLQHTRPAISQSSVGLVTVNIRLCKLLLFTGSLQLENFATVPVFENELGERVPCDVEHFL